MRMRTLVVVVPALLAVAACSGSGTSAAEPRSSGTAPPVRGSLADAPPIRSEGSVPTVSVRSAQRSLQLRPFTYCRGNRCVDGFLGNPESVGRGETVAVRTLPRATIHVSMSSGSHPRPVPGDGPIDRCRRTFSTTVVADAQGRATLRPLGPAGDHAVLLFVNPADGGDLTVGFDWTTTRSGPTNRPRAQADVLADHDGRPDSYGVDLSASDLAATPVDASAEIVVTAANGERRIIPLTRADVACDDGSVRFTAPTSEGLAAADLGAPPFTYDVAMTLDGVRYTAHAVWPRDVDDGCEPCVPLRFSPSLPRLVL